MNKTYADICYKFFVGMYTNVMVSGRYVERADMCALVKTIKFEKAHALTEDGNNAVAYTNLILITHQGVTMQIANPETDLGTKLNICFAAFDKLTDKTKGKIVIKHNNTYAYLPND